MLGLGKKQDTIDLLAQAMGRAIRVDGAVTQDNLLKSDIAELMRNLEVVARRSQSIDSLTDLRKDIGTLNRRIYRLRRESGI